MIKEMIDQADRYNKLKYIPTPDEIKAACKEIRREWSAETRRNRDAYRVEDGVSVLEGKMTSLVGRGNVENDYNN